MACQQQFEVIFVNIRWYQTIGVAMSRVPAKQSGPSKRDVMLSVIQGALDGGIPADISIKSNGDIKMRVVSDGMIVNAEMKSTGGVRMTNKVEAPVRSRGDASVREDARKLHDLGYTQQEIGNMLGRSQSAISGYLRDDNE